MKLGVIRLGFTACLVWGGIVFLIALANMVLTGYGDAFLIVIDSIYPGYHMGQWGFAGVIVATLYAALDGFVVGIIFAWLYNLIGKSKKD
ncbi:MAG TPA: hypothetical protein VMW92_06635 [Candidatus Heimdallarchaeota archaeon]|nr:hypothetical protein [Candidatus Heimdallarchaeota archaeon]